MCSIMHLSDHADVSPLATSGVVANSAPAHVCGHVSDHVSGHMSDHVSEHAADHVADHVSDHVLRL
jgi:hypothetical protein